MNALPKRKMDYKHNELPAFTAEVNELAAEQQMELERAVVGWEKQLNYYVIQVQWLQHPGNVWKRELTRATVEVHHSW